MPRDEGYVRGSEKDAQVVWTLDGAPVHPVNRCILGDHLTGLPAKNGPVPPFGLARSLGLEPKVGIHLADSGLISWANRSDSWRPEVAS